MGHDKKQTRYADAMFDNADDDLYLPLAFPTDRLKDEIAPLRDDSITDDELDVDVFSKQIPANATDQHNADSLIASAMAKLSIEDRETAYNDVHGISPDIVQETPELIQIRLIELQKQIDLLPDKKAYLLAKQHDPDYVQNREFLLMFLRCDMFNCEKTALRIIRHFQIKLGLFGEDKLARNITQDDLDIDDIDALYSSNGRFLNAYDSGGRIINFLFKTPKAYKTDSVLRRSFYNIMETFRDEEVQRHGSVCIAWALGGIKGTTGDNPELNWKLSKLNEGSPMRISAFHLCIDGEAWKGQLALIRTSFSKKIQVRSRVHHGTVPELLQTLRGHGIDPNDLPLNEKGENTDHLEIRRKLERQRQQERLQLGIPRIVGVPFSKDVLLGKGPPFQWHPGNRNLRRLVGEWFQKYERAPKGIKKTVVQDLIDFIKASGGLFIKQDDNKWVPVDDEVAVLKVSAAFRTHRQKQK